MWICSILFIICFIGFAFADTVLLQILFGVTASMFLCTGLLIETLNKLFKKFTKIQNEK